MSDNPLVAAPVASEPSAFGGAYLLQDGADLANAIQSGNWVEGGMAAFSTAVNTIAAVIDPIGTLLANGLGWVLDHIEPLRGWLQDLTGNAAEVQAFAQTWANVSNQLNQVGGDLQHRLADLDDMSGETITAYRAHVQALADTVASTGTWSGAVGSGLEIASTLVQAVYELVRDGIAQVVGTAISALITAGATLGLGTPVAVGQIVARVSSVATRVGRFIENLLSSARKLMPLFDKLCSVLAKLFRRGHGGAAEDVHLSSSGTAAPTPDGSVNGTAHMPTSAPDPSGASAPSPSQSGAPNPVPQPATPPIVPTQPVPATPSRPVSYKRPSGYRKGVRDTVYEQNRGPDGHVRNPRDQSIIGPDDKWDMGHKPGFEFRHHAASAEERGIPRSQFLDEHNDPSHYRPELGKHNRDHQDELGREQYQGP
ncbi:HNH/ENDO VII superfamily nuclease [Microbacterium sp. AG157]|uniref:GH-E family nuclease n=1 Tax=Microbacterium sp. AG157 TaxID=2183993 RepID=UPI000E225AE3|nr:GH-E family nuclease [Microbacterium sp. AG157]REC98259.1 HNH/ENDO VII superfamily nuclease [Microbacterium sp. AG157]